MCNFCECENFERCSIIGNIPLGFCCQHCNNYNEEKTCLKSKTKLEERLKTHSKSIQTLREAFAKSPLSIKDLKNYP